LNKNTGSVDDLLSHVSSQLPDYKADVLRGVRVTRSLVLYVCFVDRCLPFCTFFWPLCFLVFFDIRILITSLVSSNSSCSPFNSYSRYNIAMTKLNVTVLVNLMLILQYTFNNEWATVGRDCMEVRFCKNLTMYAQFLSTLAYQIDSRLWRIVLNITICDLFISNLQNIGGTPVSLNKTGSLCMTKLLLQWR
jgi:hypothetical protein